MNSLAPIRKPVQKMAIRFHARSFVAFALAPEAPLDDWLQRLDSWTANSPGFFAGRQVVLDLKALGPTLSELTILVAQLGERGIRIYAIEAEGLGDLGPHFPPVLTGAKPANADERRPDRTPREPVREERAAPASMIIRSPVRSGQSIFQPHGDVIVLGSVGSGSEIIAGGSVHIYGTLRGRVFAGADGNAEARIFCQRNEAELLAVDGWYLSADDMQPSTRGQPIQAFLENGVIRIAALT